MQLNNLLASPSFAVWREGEPLDIHRLLYTPEGHPRHSIFAIAHLSDAERMFFVSMLLNEVIAWMRTLPGTPSLRAILYMDEIFGYFPPTAVPPSKVPMLTLLKQARAYGLGVLLATQEPRRPGLQGVVEHRNLVPPEGFRRSVTKSASSMGSKGHRVVSDSIDGRRNSSWLV